MNSDLDVTLDDLKEAEDKLIPSYKKYLQKTKTFRMIVRVSGIISTIVLVYTGAYVLGFIAYVLFFPDIETILR